MINTKTIFIFFYIYKIFQSVNKIVEIPQQNVNHNDLFQQYQQNQQGVQQVEKQKEKQQKAEIIQEKQQKNFQKGFIKNFFNSFHVFSNPSNIFNVFNKNSNKKVTNIQQNKTNISNPQINKKEEQPTKNEIQNLNKNFEYKKPIISKIAEQTQQTLQEIEQDVENLCEKTPQETILARAQRYKIPSECYLDDSIIQHLKADNFIDNGGFGFIYKVPEGVVKSQVLDINNYKRIIQEYNYLEFLSKSKIQNFAKIFSCYFSNSKLGYLFSIVMEYLPGSLSYIRAIDEDTKQIIESPGFYFREHPILRNPKIRLEKYIELFEALSYLHQNKIIHNDIKPANIMSTKKLEILQKEDLENLHLILIDYGISSQEGEKQIGGSAFFMHPEFWVKQQKISNTLNDVYQMCLSVLIIENYHSKLKYPDYQKGESITESYFIKKGNLVLNPQKLPEFSKIVSDSLNQDIAQKMNLKIDLTEVNKILIENFYQEKCFQELNFYCVLFTGLNFKIEQIPSAQQIAKGLKEIHNKMIELEKNIFI